MEISDRAKGEGLQIPLFNAAGLQIRPNGERCDEPVRRHDE